METFIHPMAVVDPNATIEDGVHIGPFCSVGPWAVLRTGVKLVSHVSIAGRIDIGARTLVYPFASLGHPPQDLKYDGEASETIIGPECTIREYVTIQPGTKGDRMRTTVGERCLLMVGVHIAHDCVVGNNVIMANQATLGGHVVIEDNVIVGGLSAVQQFVRIGKHAIIGGMSGVEKDVLPYAMIMGERAHLSGLNVVGLRRHQFSNQAIQRIQDTYHLIFSEEGTLAERMEKIKAMLANEPSPECDDLLRFIALSKKSLCTPKKK